MRASLGLIAAVAKLDAGDGTALHVRVGIATGLVVVGDLIGQGSHKNGPLLGNPQSGRPVAISRLPEHRCHRQHDPPLLGGLFEYRPLGRVS